jgi:hypothetical protein
MCRRPLTAFYSGSIRDIRPFTADPIAVIRVNVAFITLYPYESYFHPARYLTQPHRSVPAHTGAHGA